MSTLPEPSRGHTSSTDRRLQESPGATCPPVITLRSAVCRIQRDINHTIQVNNLHKVIFSSSRLILRSEPIHLPSKVLTLPFHRVHIYFDGCANRRISLCHKCNYKGTTQRLRAVVVG